MANASDMHAIELWSFSSITVCREPHDQAAASKHYIIKCNAKFWVQWCKVHCHWPLEQSSGNVLSGVMNHTAPSGNLIDESGFGGCQENSTYLTALCQV